MKFSKHYCFKSFKLYCSLCRAHKAFFAFPTNPLRTMPANWVKVAPKKWPEIAQKLPKNPGIVSPLLECKKRHLASYSNLFKWERFSHRIVTCYLLLVVFLTSVKLPNIKLSVERQTNDRAVLQLPWLWFCYFIMLNQLGFWGHRCILWRSI